MVGQPMNIIKRRDATYKTLSRWRGQGFSWNSGDNATCVHLLHAHLYNMGHEPPPIPDFKSIHGAVTALRSHGWSNLSEMLDAHLERRPSPSFMRMGDVALGAGDGPLDAVFICAGPLKVFGWHETRDDLVVMEVNLDELIGAWAT